MSAGGGVAAVGRLQDESATMTPALAGIVAAALRMVTTNAPRPLLGVLQTRMLLGGPKRACIRLVILADLVFDHRRIPGPPAAATEVAIVERVVLTG